MMHQSANEQFETDRKNEGNQQWVEAQPQSVMNQQQRKLEKVEDSQVESSEDGEEFSAYNPQITINESSVNQMLTVLLEPNQSIWYWGEIIVSNRPYSNQDNQGFNNFDLDRIFHYVKMKWRVPMKLDNKGLEMAYFCIRRRGGGGKILHIDSSVYGETFVWDMSKLLTINHDPINYEVESLSSIPNLSRLKLKSVEDHAVQVCLQSNPGHLIYEKSLGESEKLFLGNSQVIAMSEKIQVKRVGECLALEGPGYVFMEAPVPLMHPQTIPPINLTIFLLVLILMTFLVGMLNFFD